MTIYPSSFTMIEGESRKIEVIVSPRNASYSSIRWISSNNKVVSVTNGLVSALAPGRAEITAIAGSVSGKSDVLVESRYINVTSVHLEPMSAELLEGDVTQFTATVISENATNKNVRWESSDTNVAMVSNGQVTAVKAGSATIKVITDDGDRTAECAVTVKPKNINGGFEGIGEEEW